MCSGVSVSWCGPWRTASVSLQEVRQQLDNLVGAQTDAMRRSMWWNAVACPIFLPLMLTPVSNLPVYWFGWRAWSNWRAARGGYALRALLDAAAPEGSLLPGVDVFKKCTRVSGSGDASVDDAAVCCRIAHGAGDLALSTSATAGEESPEVLFVPCQVLDAADARGAAGGWLDAFDPEPANEVERLMGAEGVVALARRYFARSAKSSHTQ